MDDSNDNDDLEGVFIEGVSNDSTSSLSDAETRSSLASSLRATNILQRSYAAATLIQERLFRNRATTAVTMHRRHSSMEHEETNITQLGESSYAQPPRRISALHLAFDEDSDDETPEGEQQPIRLLSKSRSTEEALEEKMPPRRRSSDDLSNYDDTGYNQGRTQFTESALEAKTPPIRPSADALSSLVSDDDKDRIVQLKEEESLPTHARARSRSVSPLGEKLCIPLQRLSSDDPFHDVTQHADGADALSSLGSDEDKHRTVQLELYPTFARARSSSSAPLDQNLPPRRLSVVLGSSNEDDGVYLSSDDEWKKERSIDSSEERAAVQRPRLMRKQSSDGLLSQRMNSRLRQPSADGESSMKWNKTPTMLPPVPLQRVNSLSSSEDEWELPTRMNTLEPPLKSSESDLEMAMLSRNRSSVSQSCARMESPRRKSMSPDVSEVDPESLAKISTEVAVVKGLDNDDRSLNYKKDDEWSDDETEEEEKPKKKLLWAKALGAVGFIVGASVMAARAVVDDDNIDDGGGYSNIQDGGGGAAPQPDASQAFGMHADPSQAVGAHVDVSQVAQVVQPVPAPTASALPPLPTMSPAELQMLSQMATQAASNAAGAAA